MDEIVRIYCPNGVFNDCSLGYDGKSLENIMQEIKALQDKKLEQINDLEELLKLSKKIENVEGNVLVFYREMAYEDDPLGDHSDIENDYKIYIQKHYFNR